METGNWKSLNGESLKLESEKPEERKKKEDQKKSKWGGKEKRHKSGRVEEGIRRKKRGKGK